MQRKHADGSTEYEHLQSIAAQTGVVPDDLQIVEVPACLRALWQTFLALHGQRFSALGRMPITQSEIWHWQRNNGVRLTPWEIETLHLLDQVVTQIQDNP